jgi:predicted membrane protein (TIGR00267 family)
VNSASASRNGHQDRRAVLFSVQSFLHGVDLPPEAADPVEQFLLVSDGPRRASRSALTIALSYVAGGLVPLAPPFFLRSIHSALVGSVLVTLLALLVFGYIKGRFTTAKPVRSAWQTVVVGGLAATAAFVIAKAIG